MHRHLKRSHPVSKEIHLTIKLSDATLELDRFDSGTGSIYLEIAPRYAEEDGVVVELTEDQAKELYNGLFTAMYGTRPAWVPPHESAKVSE